MLCRFLAAWCNRGRAGFAGEVGIKGVLGRRDGCLQCAPKYGEKPRMTQSVEGMGEGVGWVEVLVTGVYDRRVHAACLRLGCSKASLTQGCQYCPFLDVN